MLALIFDVRRAGIKNFWRGCFFRGRFVRTDVLGGAPPAVSRTLPPFLLTTQTFLMGFDKAKVLRAAEKYLAQGKIPAAIAEYRQIVENDADDVMALNVLGDLYARADKKREAVSCFLRIADHYREQGFVLKAIAMYKKIERLQPGAPEIASQLAAL